MFRTQVLCPWVTSVKAAIPAGIWSALADGQAKQGKTVVFALDVTPDHSTASIAVGWTRHDGTSQVQLADHREGTDLIVDRAAELTKRWGAPLYVGNPGTAAFLLPSMVAAGVKPTRSRAASTLTPALGSRPPSGRRSYAMATRMSSRPRWQSQGGPFWVMPGNVY